ncbi:MAG: TrkA family potassium uptake protein [Sulfurospirillum sp.]|nr:TrkA family potassium uptake protein [Sulfurospirillum sp.]
MKKVLIFGYTKTGREIAKLLPKNEYDLYIIDENPMRVAQANQDGFFAQHSVFSDDKLLVDMGIGADVSVLFCASNDESLNLFVTLSARSLDKELKILTLIQNQKDEKRMILAGANRTISPYGVGAIKAFRIIDKPKVSSILNLFARQSNKLSIQEIEIPKGSILDGLYFKDVSIFKEFDTMFLGILDREMGDEFIFFTKGINHKIDCGDVVVVLGSKENIKKLKEKIGAS